MVRNLLEVKVDISLTGDLSFFVGTDYGYISAHYGNIYIFNSGNTSICKLQDRFSLSENTLHFINYAICTTEWQEQYGRIALELMVNSLNTIMDIHKKYNEAVDSTTYSLVGIEEYIGEFGLKKMRLKIEKKMKILGTKMLYLEFDESKSPRFEEKKLYDFVCEWCVKNNVWTFGDKSGDKFVVEVPDNETFQKEFSTVLEKIYKFYL